jgi:hypothetical protein
MTGRRPGRPPHGGKAREAVVRLRATPEQVAAWRAAAERGGVDLSAWLRSLADDAAGADPGEVRDAYFSAMVVDMEAGRWALVASAILAAIEDASWRKR